jgi:hypothetical protein
MNNVERNGQVIGYYYYCNLSKAYIAVKASGERATAQRQFQAVNFIEN